MINKTVREIQMSGVRKMFEMSDDDAINLGLGQPDLQPPDDIIEAYEKAMLDGHNGYGSTYGLPALREEIAKKQSQYKSGLTADNVLITVGATQAFQVSLVAVLEKGDEVLYPEPGFVLYRPQIRLASGRPVSYPVEQKNEFVPQIEELEERRTRDTKAIIVNSPSNPTGGVFSKGDVERITEWAEENDILIISDEVYEKMIYEGDHSSFLGDYENTIVINSFSKTFAMTGWRIGFLITKPKWVNEIGKVHYYTIACPPNPTQHAILYGLKNRLDFVENMTDIFRERREAIVNRLNDIPGFQCLKPRGAFYAFPSFDYDLSSEELSMELLDEGVISTPGNAFGPTGEGHIRFSYANSTENIKAGMNILEDVVKGLEG